MDPGRDLLVVQTKEIRWISRAADDLTHQEQKAKKAKKKNNKRIRELNLKNLIQKYFFLFC